MIKLELDWAGDNAPDTGVVCDDGEVVVVVEYDDKSGPSGWPTVVVYATHAPHAPAYRASMAMDAWLEQEYGMESGDERDDLLTLAVDC